MAWDMEKSVGSVVLLKSTYLLTYMFTVNIDRLAEVRYSHSDRL